MCPRNQMLYMQATTFLIIDPPLIALAAWKTIAYMAKQELFHDDNKLLRFLVHTLGGFAVNREKPEIATFKTVKSVFNTSLVTGYFPAGQNY